MEGGPNKSRPAAVNALVGPSNENNCLPLILGQAKWVMCGATWLQAKSAEYLQEKEEKSGIRTLVKLPRKWSIQSKM
jgi:hypothetical protein